MSLSLKSLAAICLAPALAVTAWAGPALAADALAPKKDGAAAKQRAAKAAKAAKAAARKADKAEKKKAVKAEKGAAGAPAVKEPGAPAEQKAPLADRKVVAKGGEAGGEAGAEEGGEEGGEGELEVEEFADDLVVLKSDIGIWGRIIRQTPDAIKIEVAAGTFWIKRSSIKRIELNLAARINKLAEDDYAGKYRLAMDALRMGQANQARPILDGLVGKPGIPTDIYKTLADMLEEEGDLEKALEYLKRYQMSNPDDKELKAKIAEITKKLGSSGGAVAGGAGAVNEGMEVGGAWNVLPWANPVKTGLQDLQGNKALMLHVPAGGKDDKAAVNRYVKLDLRDKTKISLRVFNAEKRTVQLAMAITTSTFYESRPIRLSREWNVGVSFNIKSKKWKCRETNWRYEAGIDDLDKVTQLIFLVYCGNKKALLYLDSIRAE
ncbi:MAG: tetratricopeptide repeat protein [Planctomycetota bacterium]